MHQLNAGQVIEGFEVISEESIPEVEGYVYMMKHVASNARVMFISNNDENKAFGISFKTPPKDSTGVFHIIEHSTLNGSQKYPVKEPFVNLLKSSMQTFLNAMTYPDKTVYPVSSTNDKDLINLASIYLDAVFNPLFYERKSTFLQEGWRYEYQPACDSASEKLEVNGVVYSEMSGVLSEPEAVMDDAIMEALFPDTQYRFESGGDPQAIPNLTYEDFLDTHSRHYSLRNSYTTLYGDIDIENFLQLLGQVFDAQHAKEKSNGVGEINPFTLQTTPVKNMGIKRTMHTAPEKSLAAVAFVVGDYTQNFKIDCVNIILSALMRSNESPLKKALLDAGICGNVGYDLVRDCAQPFAVIHIEDLKTDDAAQKLEQIVTDVFTQQVEDGIEVELLEATISRNEFKLRKGDSAGLEGINYITSCLLTWLYDDNNPTECLKYEDLLAELKSKLGTGYYEQIVREVFLENPHICSVEIVPTEDSDTTIERQLEETLKHMSAEQLEQITSENAMLKQVQSTPDTPEQVATIPMLTLDDISEARGYRNAPLDESNSLPCLMHEDINTKGIAYASWYFDLGCISFDDISSVQTMCEMLGKFDTELRSAIELNTLIMSKLGHCAFTIQPYQDVLDHKSFSVKLVVSASALENNVEYLVNIPKEIIRNTQFDDSDKLRKLLMHSKANFEKIAIAYGNMVGITRASARVNASAATMEKISGVESYCEIKNALEHFDEASPLIVSDASNLCRKIFQNSNCICSFAGSDEAAKRFWAADPRIGFDDDTSLDMSIFNPQLLQVQDEAFIVPSVVAFNSVACDASNVVSEYNKSWDVASRAINLDYLWNAIRVQGGAYGCGYSLSNNFVVNFTSFRDPNIQSTLQAYANTFEWLRNSPVDNDELLGYIISSVASVDKPEKPQTMIAKQNSAFFTRSTLEYRKTLRNQILSTDMKIFGELAGIIEESSKSSATCIFAGKDLISEANLGFEIIDLFSE